MKRTYELIRLYGSKFLNIIRLIPFLHLRKCAGLFFQLLRDFFSFHFKDCSCFEIRKIACIRSWMDEMYGELVPTALPPIKESSEECPIWVFWYQGESAMPDVVKMCYDNLVTVMRGGGSVHLLDKNNLASYITLPDIVNTRLQRGELSYTHYSDILRICLLYEKGGVWMDSTLFITAPVTVDTMHYFSSLKIATGDRVTISDYRWASFFIASAKGNPAFKVIRDVFLAYLEKYDKMIDYLFIDYIIDMLYRKNEAFRRSADSIPATNPGLYRLINEMNRPFDEDRYHNILCDTTLFKLNHKVSFHENIDGRQTLYGYLKNHTHKSN